MAANLAQEPDTLSVPSASRDWPPTSTAPRTHTDQDPCALHAVGSNSSLRADVSFGERTHGFYVQLFFGMVFNPAPHPARCGNTRRDTQLPSSRHGGSGVEDVQRQVYNRALWSERTVPGFFDAKMEHDPKS